MVSTFCYKMSLTFSNILLEMKKTNRNVAVSLFKILEYPEALTSFSLNNITSGSIIILVNEI